MLCRSSIKTWFKAFWGIFPKSAGKNEAAISSIGTKNSKFTFAQPQLDAESTSGANPTKFHVDFEFEVHLLWNLQNQWAFYVIDETTSKHQDFQNNHNYLKFQTIVITSSIYHCAFFLTSYQKENTFQTHKLF